MTTIKFWRLSAIFVKTFKFKALYTPVRDALLKPLKAFNKILCTNHILKPLFISYYK